MSSILNGGATGRVLKKYEIDQDVTDDVVVMPIYTDRVRRYNTLSKDANASFEQMFENVSIVTTSGKEYKHIYAGTIDNSDNSVLTFCVPDESMSIHNVSTEQQLEYIDQFDSNLHGVMRKRVSVAYGCIESISGTIIDKTVKIEE